MEIVKLTTTVNATGRLHIDIPTRLSPGKVQAVLVLHPVAASDRHYDFSDLAGQLSWKGDAVAVHKKADNKL
ncbi:MAG: hypothetical protein Q3M30_10725 [Candidatus Electrothrix sp. Rat3]|uniref:hypothetical protein n=1 Tax=Candidatus Electrothrix sp. TaxID=2170559 RepID=UPI00291BC735|nr:hypothetical protein [Candidatus Electrothrix rattekaaiensis]